MQEERHLRQPYYSYDSFAFLIIENNILFFPQKLLNKVSEMCLFPTFNMLGLITAWPAQ